jgi:subtilisin family serine protease
MSFGSTDFNPALYDAIENSGALFVCAAGNARLDLMETPVYPAGYDLPNVLAVASVNDDGGFSYFSNYGDNMIDMAALGRGVESAMPGDGKGKMSGTSVAAGTVTGAAAAVLSLYRKVLLAENS